MTSGIHRILRGCEHPPALAKPSDERAAGEPARRSSRVVVLGDSEFAETGARLGDDPAGILGLELLGIEAAAI